MNKMKPERAQNSYDVIVVGGGIVGQSMALGLAQQSYKVCLIDRSTAPKIAPSNNGKQAQFSPRVSAMSAASQTLLENLGAWQLIDRKQCYSKMHVWDQDGFGDIEFDATELAKSRVNAPPLKKESSRNGACLGHIIENDQLTLALHKALSEYENADMVYDSAIANMQSSEQEAQIVLKDNKILTSRLIIGADGANSQVRKAFGFTQTFWDYDHQAIVVNVKTELPHNNCARQVFTPFGPLAFLPLPDPNQSSIVFSQQSEQAATLMALNEDDFSKALQVAIDNHYGKVSLLNLRQSYPLRMRYARQWSGTRVALIGDAAHTIHPLAGQGANLGLSDVSCMLKKLAELADTPELLGRQRELRQYERQQKTEAIKVIATMESFKQLFDGNHPLKKLVRNTGLAGANKIPMIKRFFMHQAMG